jgi:ParB family chromosome partitioning protein
LYLDNPSVSDDAVPKIKLFDDEYLVIDEKCGLKTIWELQSYLPQMEKELFDQLKESIRKNGLIDPILFYKTKQGEKLVIEGHTRFSAAISLKLKEIPSKEIKEDFQSLDDIKFWMVKHQIQRRNLTKIEKLEYAYLFKESIENKGKENLSKAGKGEKINEKIDTYSEIAKLAGISRPTVQRYDGVLSNAPKSVIEKMRNGELSISGAYKSVEKKKNRKAEKTVKSAELSYVMVDSIESAKEKMKNGELEMILMIEKNRFQQGIPKLPKKMGVFILK